MKIKYAVLVHRISSGFYIIYVGNTLQEAEAVAKNQSLQYKTHCYIHRIEMPSITSYYNGEEI